jgi:hypothetical protein
MNIANANARIRNVMIQGSLAVSKIARRSHKECFFQEPELGCMDDADVAVADPFGFASFASRRPAPGRGRDSADDGNGRSVVFESSD